MAAMGKVIAALGERVKIRRQNGVQAQCPTHADQRASLAVVEKEGRVLLKCHAGCDNRDIMAALNLRWADLFNEPRERSMTPQDRIEKTYDYVDERGILLYQVVRFVPKDFRVRKPDGKGGWAWGINGTRRVPYMLPDVLSANFIWIVEGEKDADRLQAEGFCATTNAGGAGKWDPAWSIHFKGVNVAIIPDDDEPGHAHAEMVAKSLKGYAQEIRIVCLPDAKDVSDWLGAGHKSDELERLAKNSKTYGAPAQLPKATEPEDPIIKRLADIERRLKILETPYGG